MITFALSNQTKMDFVKATQKITDCIETAETKGHFKAIDNMIKNVENVARFQCPLDKSLFGATALLSAQNQNKFAKIFGRNELNAIFDKN